MDGFVRRTVAAIGLATLAVASAVLVWRGVDVLLLVFAGVLLALFLRGLAGRTARLTGLPDGAAVAVVVVVLAALTGVGGWLIAPPLAEQAAELVQRLSEAVGRVREGLTESPWGQRVLSYLPGPDDLRASEIVQRAGGTLVTTLGWFLGGVANVGVIMFIGLYVAFAPEPYARGLLSLVPPASRPRAQKVLDGLGETLQRWLLGKLVGMLLIGTLTAAGLALVGIPLALALGLLAGLLNFVPYLGPLLAFVPAGLLGLVQGPGTLLWVLGIYVVIQALESYVVTPLIQQKAVALPPALIVTAQVLLGVVLGWLGLLLATPLTAAVVVLVQGLYIEGIREAT